MTETVEYDLPETSAFVARYPFTDGARETVSRSSVGLPELLDCDTVRERAVERLVRTVRDGRVGPVHPYPPVELCSYPVARSLVSAVGEERLVRRYVTAEADTVMDRVHEDIEERQDMETVSDVMTVDRMLFELKLSEAVSIDDSIEVAVTTWLTYAERSLTSTKLADGWVPVEEPELYRLIRSALVEHIGRGLPLDVPDAVRSEVLGEAVETVRAVLGPGELPTSFERPIDPSAVSDCLRRLLSTDELDEAGRFVRDSFVSATTGQHADYQPPSCEGMQRLELCLEDGECLSYGHPLSHYSGVSQS